MSSIVKSVSLVQIFVSSPSDVTEDRVQLEGVIEELNKTVASALGLRLELLRWETHARPGLGIDAQDVINRQIGDDYDIFIGIMWTRFGSPTTSSSSGTEDEFERALARARRKPGSVRILFYFKDTRIAPSEIDPDQWSKIAEFKVRLRNEGLLYSEYSGPFDDFVRVHLARELIDWTRSAGPGTTPETSREGRTAPRVSSDDDEEPEPAPSGSEETVGVLDGGLEFREHIKNAWDALTRLGAAVEQLGLKFTDRTGEVREAANRGADVPTMITLADAAAADLEEFVGAIERDTPVFGDEFRAAGRAFIAVLPQLRGFASASGDVNELEDTLTTILDQVDRSVTSTALFQESLASMPGLTKRFNKAKRRATTSLDNLVEQMRGQSSVLKQLIDAVREFSAA